MAPRTSHLLQPVVLTALMVAGAPPLMAQERTSGSRVLTFDTIFGLQVGDNPELETNGDSRFDAITSFRLGLITVTEAERLEMSAGFGLRASAGDDSTDDFSIIDPDLNFGYARQSRGAELRIDGRVRRTEASRLSPLELTTDEIVDLEELEDLLDLDNSVEVDLLSFSLNAALETGRDRPLGVTYSLGVAGTRYSPETTSLEDSTRLTAGIGLRGDLTETLRATSNLSYTIDDDDGTDDIARLDFGLSQRFATATLGTRLAFVDDSTGLRTSLSVTGGLDRPNGELGGSLGVTRLDDGDLALIGTARAAYDLPAGSIGFDLSRSVSQIDNNGVKEVRGVTTLAADYNRNLTRLWQVGVDARHVWTDSLDDGGTDGFGQIGVDLSRQITPDWSLTLGATHGFETDSDGADVSGSILSVPLGRSVRIPF